MKTALYLIGIALFVVGMIALLLGVREFYAALFICTGSIIAAIGGEWDKTKKEQIAGSAFTILLSGILLVHAFMEEGVGALAGLRISWIGVPLLTAVVILAVLHVRRVHKQKPNQ